MSPDRSADFGQNFRAELTEIFSFKNPESVDIKGFSDAQTAKTFGDFESAPL
jgi:hypothetical protein